MFYKMIERARDAWYTSAECTVGPIVEYIETKGKMRDAQIDAIKTYLYLKIGCDSRSLAELFCAGRFNTMDLENAEISNHLRQHLKENPAAAALFEYACLENEKGEQVSEKLEAAIKKAPEDIEYRRFFREAFYGVTYTDYLFSLPMGAGKTYLMAAFIYLDLYFAKNEPDNPAFAHNFILFAPSGLKSSVVPSLRTIQKFDPSWVIPEPASSDLKRELSFEVLDQSKTTKKSNKTKNPNVQKIAGHQPFSELFGLVAVTNAEKVILDRVEEKNGQISWFDESADDKDRQANELRNLIGKLPSLSIFIDEVHHAVTEEVKLRAVVSKWAENKTVNSVIGFSGTPYLEKAEKLSVTGKLSVATAEITNIVYYYPLAKGIGNFLKCPVVKISETAESERIIEKGVREFLDIYGNTVYEGNLTAKLGIYCGTIEKLEETVYPLVLRIAAEYGMDSGAILRFHKGNKQHPQPADSPMQFDTLDTPLSEIKIVLLVQIGKEGWDCRSLTGIILSQEGDCPKNMVLQTSCRCLRQVEKEKPETALIYLNGVNGGKLEAQLQKQHHISVQEFMKGNEDGKTRKRYSRMEYLKLPQIDFYQFRIQYDMVVVESTHTEKQIGLAPKKGRKDADGTKVTDFSMKVSGREFDETERGDVQATFLSWVYGIAKESFGTLAVKELLAFEVPLRKVYDTVTYVENKTRYYSSKYDIEKVNAHIRKAFAAKRDFTSSEELVAEKAALLKADNFKSKVKMDNPDAFYPEEITVDNIILDDNGEFQAKADDLQLIERLRNMNNPKSRPLLEDLLMQTSSHPQRLRSFHYLPYRFDSRLERWFLETVFTFPELEEQNLEVYYNGDKSVTDFKIKCYKKQKDKWIYIGLYTPDFLILERKDGQIKKVLIVETKGAVYANVPEFQDRRAFMEQEFIKRNNEAFGYGRFDYLYLEDTLTEEKRISLMREKLKEFFEEEK